MLKGNLLAPISSALVVMLGLLAMAGWVAHDAEFIVIMHGYGKMVFNTAFCFVCAGSALLCYVLAPTQQYRYLILASFVFVIAMVTFAEYVFNMQLGIDYMFIDPWLIDDNQFPGRMAKNTARAFLTMSTTILLLPWAKQRATAILVQMGIIFTIMQGLMPVIGYMLDLEFLYVGFGDARMSLQTAMAFVLLGVSLSSVWSKTECYKLLYHNREDKKILVISALILAMIALIAGLAGFSTQKEKNQEILKSYLNEALVERMQVFQATLKRPMSEMTADKDNLAVVRMMMSRSSSRQEQDEVTRQLFLRGYSAIKFIDASQNVNFERGNFVGQSPYIFDLDIPFNGKLIWKDGFILQLTNTIISNKKIIGKMIAQWPLDNVNQLLLDNNFFICGSTKQQQFLCLPRLAAANANGNIFAVKSAQSKLLQASITGRMSVVRGVGVDKQDAMAIIQPMRALHLSFIYKGKTAHLYQPLRRQLEFALILMLGVIFFGVLLLYWQVLPLLRKVISSEQKEHDSSVRLSAIVNHAAEGIVTVNENNVIETINPTAVAIFNYPYQDIAGKDVDFIVAKNKEGRPLVSVSDYLRGDAARVRSKRNIEILAQRKNGEIFPLEFSATEMHLEQHRKFVIIMRDISARKLAEDKLQESENRFRLAFDSAANGVSLVDLNGRWLRVNPALCRITGYSEKEMLSMCYRDISHPDDDALHIDKVKQMLEGAINSCELEKRYIRKDGKIIWVNISVAVIRDKNNKPLYTVGQTQEITNKKRQQEELSYQAYYDSLTGLVNRSQLEQDLEHAIVSALRQQKSFSVFFIDLDHFKQINDSLGHDVGDKLLKIVADRLRNSVRMTDVASRLGGDEFVLVLNGINTPEAAADFAEKIMSVIMRPIEVHEHEMNIGMSIGISFFPNDGKEGHALIKSADLALYRAKESGRNNYQFCTPEMNNDITERMKFKAALQVALEKKEFHLEYLPKLDVSSGTISAVEALLRWKDELYGNVSPSKIISLAEESGLILPLSEWIINASCQQTKIWQHARAAKLNVAMNVSKRQFKNAHFAESVLRAIQSSGLAPHHLELEISENLLMQDPEYSLKVIHALKDIGVQVTMDNFGTGYSSLVYLHRFAVDRIKIDRSLVQQMTMNTWHASLVTAIVSLAKNLGVSVAVEGVETKEQYAYLLQYGCDEMQGYLISRPLGAVDVMQHLDKRLELI